MTQSPASFTLSLRSPEVSMGGNLIGTLAMSQGYEKCAARVRLVAEAKGEGKTASRDGVRYTYRLKWLNVPAGNTKRRFELRVPPTMPTVSARGLTVEWQLEVALRFNGLRGKFDILHVEPVKLIIGPRSMLWAKEAQSSGDYAAQSQRELWRRYRADGWKRLTRGFFLGGVLGLLTAAAIIASMSLLIGAWAAQVLAGVVLFTCTLAGGARSTGWSFAAPKVRWRKPLITSPGAAITAPIRIGWPRGSEPLVWELHGVAAVRWRGKERLDYNTVLLTTRDHFFENSFHSGVIGGDDIVRFTLPAQAPPSRLLGCVGFMWYVTVRGKWGPWWWERHLPLTVVPWLA